MIHRYWIIDDQRLISNIQSGRNDFDRFLDEIEAYILKNCLGWMKEPPYSLAKVFTKGKIVFETLKPDGTPRKLLDVSIPIRLGWKSKIGLEHGIQKTYDWYVENISN